MDPVTYIFAAEWCDCIHESGFALLSMHSTKQGAYRALRQQILSAWNGWNNETPDRTFPDKGPKSFRLNSNRRRRKDHRVALAYKAWRVRPVPLFQ